MENNHVLDLQKEIDLPSLTIQNKQLCTLFNSYDDFDLL